MFHWHKRALVKRSMDQKECRIRWMLHTQIHADEMAEASAHYKKMEDLVGTKVSVRGIKDGKF